MYKCPHCQAEVAYGEVLCPDFHEIPSEIYEDKSEPQAVDDEHISHTSIDNSIAAQQGSVQMHEAKDPSTVEQQGGTELESIEAAEIDPAVAGGAQTSDAALQPQDSTQAAQTQENAAISADAPAQSIVPETQSQGVPSVEQQALALHEQLAIPEPQCQPLSVVNEAAKAPDFPEEVAQATPINAHASPQQVATEPHTVAQPLPAYADATNSQLSAATELLPKTVTKLSGDTVPSSGMPTGNDVAAGKDAEVETATAATNELEKGQRGDALPTAAETQTPETPAHHGAYSQAQPAAMVGQVNQQSAEAVSELADGQSSSTHDPQAAAGNSEATTLAASVPNGVTPENKTKWYVAGALGIAAIAGAAIFMSQSKTVAMSESPEKVPVAVPAATLPAAEVPAKVAPVVAPVAEAPVTAPNPVPANSTVAAPSTATAVAPGALTPEASEREKAHEKQIQVEREKKKQLEIEQNKEKQKKDKERKEKERKEKEKKEKEQKEQERLQREAELRKQKEAAASVKPAPVANTWLSSLRRELAACESEGAFKKMFCAEKVRWKYCAPDRWGTVAECPGNKN